MSEEKIYFPESLGPIDFMFNSLFDEDVLVQKNSAWDPLVEEQFLLATYKTDNQKIAIVGAVSFDVAAGLAAFFTRFQCSVLTDIIKNKQLTDELMGNFYEIMNISSHIFNKEEYDHIAIHDLKVMKPSEIRPELLETIKAPKNRIDASISISSGYGKGYMSYFKASKLLEI